MTIYSSDRPDPRSWYSLRLDTVGDGSGVNNAIGNYASGQYFRAKADHRELKLNSLSINIRGTGQMTAADYATLPELTNGVLLHLLGPDDKILYDITAETPIRNNSDWIDFTTNVVRSDYGSGDNFIGIGFRVPDPKTPFYLPVGHSLALLFQDDMTGLVSQSMFVFGQYVQGFG